MIVMKFGGTSVGGPEEIKRVAKIIKSRINNQPLVVVSAVGGITNKLVALGENSIDRSQPNADAEIEVIRKIHAQIINDLKLEDDKNLENHFAFAIDTLTEICEKLHTSGELLKHLVDQVLSFGEFLSANILVSYLNSVGIKSVFSDARDFLVTDSHFCAARPQVDESSAKIKEIVIPRAKKYVQVTQGFIGRDSFGRTTTLGRGGSDYSATLFGSMVNAERVEIWSDVDGVLTADPSIIPDAKRIKKMTFQEAAELAYFGAKVLHPATLLPAIEKNIAVSVLNSMRPDDSGTEISKSPTLRNDGGVVKSIAYKEGLTVITVTSTRMLMAHGFMSSIFEIFEKYSTPVDLVATSEVSVSMTVDNTEHLGEIEDELKHFAEVEIETGKSIVCAVGEKMKKTPGAAAQLFGIIPDIPIHLISQGASEINISFVIDEENLLPVIKKLHKKLFSGALDPNVFA
jgi:aspartate kinase